MDLHSSWVLFLLLAQTGVFSHGQLVMPEQVNGVRGKSVNFTGSGPPSTDVETVTWTFSPKPGSTVPIYTAMKQNERAHDPYTGRVKYYRSTYTLELSGLTASDKGIYTLTVVDSTLTQLVAQTTLVVLEPVADVSITSSLPEAVEFNSTVILTCSAKGSTLTYSWTNNSAPVVADGKHVVQNDSQLIINEVLRTDLKGPITCTAKSPLESSTSAPFNLTVNYGPELVTTKRDPVADVLKKGSSVNLTCSAQSSPAAEYIWLFNNVQLPQTTATLQLSNLAEEQSGNYSCMAYNSKTKRYVPSEVIKLTVLEMISGTRISGPMSPPIAGNSTANLTCSSSTGKADIVEWFKDGNVIGMSNHITFTPDRSTITILSVQKEDAGQYRCQLKNKISNDANVYNMTIIYGPENVVIKAEKKALVGQSVTINCSYSSYPVPTVLWKFNDTVIVGETSPCLMIPSFETKNGGIYTCEASNPITGFKTSTNHNLLVKDPTEQEPSGLSSGAIAGIVIAALLVLLIIICCCIKRRKKPADVPSPY